MTVPAHDALTDLTEVSNGGTRYKLLDPYVLVGTLGRGAMGIVCLGYHRGRDSWAAVKVLSSNSHERRLSIESKSLRRFRSRHLVGIEAAGTRCGTPYLAMEFVNGETLAERKERRGGAIPLEEAVALIADACLGLTKIHRKGGVHRDIKPSNILIDASGIVKVADLGIAKQRAGTRGGLTAPGATMGTPGYMAPEQYGGAEVAQAPADVFGLAVTLLELITGNNPIRPMSTDHDSVFAEGLKLARSLQVPQGLPPQVHDALAAATLADPQQRLPNAHQFRRRLLDAVPRSRPNLEDPEATKYSPETLKELRKRASEAVRGLPRWRSSTQVRAWAGIATALAATAVVVLLALNRTPAATAELRVFVSGHPLLDHMETRAFSAGETVHLRAETPLLGAQCKWTRVEGPAEIEIPAGPDITLEVPALPRDTKLTLQVTASLAGEHAERTVVVPLRAAVPLNGIAGAADPLPAPGTEQPVATTAQLPEEVLHDGLVWKSLAGSGTWFQAAQAVESANRDITTGPKWRLPSLHELAAAEVLIGHDQLRRTASAPYGDGDRIWSNHTYEPLNEAQALEIHRGVPAKATQPLLVTKTRGNVAYFHLVRDAR